MGHATLNFDFEFEIYAPRFDGVYVVAVPLPTDGVSGIGTGQFTLGGELWDVMININRRRIHLSRRI